MCLIESFILFVPILYLTDLLPYDLLANPDSPHLLHPTLDGVNEPTEIVPSVQRGSDGHGSILSEGNTLDGVNIR